MHRPKSRQPVLAAASLTASILLPGLLPGMLAAEERPPVRLERLIPDDVIAYARFTRLTGRIETFLESGVRQKIVSSSLIEALLEDGELRRGLDRLRETEEATGLDVARLLGKACEREVVTGFFLDFSGPQGLLLARFGDGEEARGLVKRLRDAAASATGKLSRGTRSEYGGKTIETVESIAFSVIDDVLAVSNQAGVLESVIDLAAGRTTRSVFHSKTYGPAVRDGRSPFQLALRPNFLPAVRLPEKLDSIPSLLFGGWLGAVHASELLVLDLDLNGSGLVLRGASLVGPPGLDEKLEPWFPGGAASSVASVLNLDRDLATIEVHRDLAAWWANREELVEARARRKMEAFAQSVSVVFGGASFERHVLSEIDSPITLVVQRQRYPGETPEPAIPGFAAIVPLRSSATFGQALLAALQRLVGLARVEQLRQGRDRAFELSLRTKEVEGKVLHAVEIKRRGGAPSAQGLIDNFSPCLAILDHHAILSSTTALAEKLMGGLTALSASADRPRRGPAADVLSLDCGELRRALEQSRDSLGGSDVGARALELVLELFRELRFSAVRKGDLVRLSLELSLEGR